MLSFKRHGHAMTHECTRAASLGEQRLTLRTGNDNYSEAKAVSAAIQCGLLRYSKYSIVRQKKYRFRSSALRTLRQCALLDPCEHLDHDRFNAVNCVLIFPVQLSVHFERSKILYTTLEKFLI